MRCRRTRVSPAWTPSGSAATADGRNPQGAAMKMRVWLALVPVGLLASLVMGMHKSRPVPLYASNYAQMEKTVGYHLFAPTDLPRGLKPGAGGIRQGAVRVLCDYSNG